MQIHSLPSGPIGTVAYLLTDAKSGDAVLVDAPGEITELLPDLLRAERCVLRELWLTHGHWDHIQDAARLKRELGVVVRGHRDDRDLFENPAVMEQFMGESLGLEPVTIDHCVGHGERLAALGRQFEVRHVPGHCPGNVLFHEPQARVAFVGDALFNGGVGRWDFPGGDFRTLERSIRTQIYTLADDTTIFPGHGPATTVGAEKAGNPFVPAADLPQSR